ncbi:Rho-binding antiterminator [Litorivivens sp.]|uniref:Rho-binding antiterminator n=1 Tax=Litorivivens sp. TaxID=2020868 RepID=UPI003562C47F
MITCDQHDHIEIVCTYRYPIKLTLKSGRKLDCIGLDTQYDDQRRECIKVAVADKIQLIVLDDLSRLDVSVENPHFQAVSFENPNDPTLHT